ncbi:RebB family R body protein [Caulobacter sp. SL161]|uniref:RebB family R body protein n=1 Tax=Caulobacter sp. SL161 TaxID=2995156 RepID=UPI0022727735|nr:RebB family R body protein [Caulobacter sp. SL161]MCY1647035.1 RebB family R body protein [Caulobacter sp. SL161]
MAFPTAVNDQITDSVSQSNTMTLGSAPAVAAGNLFQATSHALALAAHNATFAHQQMQIIAQAVTTQGVALIYASVSGAARTLNGAEKHG